MGVSVLILGHSGAGKSTSLRNFEKGEVGIINVAGKPLPFRKRLDVMPKKACSYGNIISTLRSNDMRAYVIDDSNYLMAFENFAKAKETGYGKFVDMACNFEQLLEAANATNDDTIVYFMCHPDYDDKGRMKPKSIGKMLDEKLCIEGMFPIVLLATNGDDGYKFVTKSDGTNPVKAPMEMFVDEVIDNDLKAVDTIIREYWGMAAITADNADA